jgi:hypothetical protein
LVDKGEVAFLKHTTVQEMIEGRIDACKYSFLGEKIPCP